MLSALGIDDASHLVVLPAAVATGARSRRGGEAAEALGFDPEAIDVADTCSKPSAWRCCATPTTARS